jgi:Tol biopolymer transport system component
MEAIGPTPEGSIVFMREGADGRFQTWTACVDLTNAVQLTTTPGREAGWAVWSPAGDRIAFNANFDDPDLGDELEIWDIYTMDPDGGNVVRLTDSPGLYGDPGYSPNGTLITFDSTVPGSEGVYVMSAVDGSGKRRVTGLPDGAATDFAPRFSPDGTEIVFLGESNDHSGGLYVVGLDGSRLRQVTPGTLSPDKAAWSPDGARIVFDARSDAFSYQSLWTVKPDGTDLMHLMDGFVGEAGARHGFSAPAWSPDGSLILAVHGLHFADGAVTTRLSTIRADGTELRYVTDGKHGDAFKPDWRSAAC